MFTNRTTPLKKLIIKALKLLMIVKPKQQQITINYHDTEANYFIPPYDDPLY